MKILLFFLVFIASNHQLVEIGILSLHNFCTYLFWLANLAKGDALGAPHTSLSSPASLNHLSTHSTRRENFYVPYRDSKLTWLLRDSLGGNSKTTIIISKSAYWWHYFRLLYLDNCSGQSRILWWHFFYYNVKWSSLISLSQHFCDAPCWRKVALDTSRQRPLHSGEVDTNTRSSIPDAEVWNYLQFFFNDSCRFNTFLDIKLPILSFAYSRHPGRWSSNRTSQLSE